METYPIDESLQELPELSAIGADDLLLISEKQENDDQVQYFSKKLKYSALSAGLCAQFNIGNLAAAVQSNKNNIDILSGDIVNLSGNLYKLSTAFLSNDALTRLIPGIQTSILEISDSLSDVQPIDRLVDLSTGDGSNIQVFWLNNYAVNMCHAIAPIVKFKTPDQDYNGRIDLSDELSNITRHIIIDLSADVNVVPRFTNNCRYISDFDLTSTISAGEHVIFTMKEVEKDLMYVTRRNVLCVDSGTGDTEVIVALVYRKAIDDKIYTDVIPTASADTRLSDYPDYCYELSDIKPPSKYFGYWVDTRYPDKYIFNKDYPGYYVSADMVLCAVYTDVAPILVYFYGANVSGVYGEGVVGPSIRHLVKDCSPQYFRNNMSGEVPGAGYIVEGTHIPYGTEPLPAWAEGSPSGMIRLTNDWFAWSLSAPELSSGYAELKYYVLYKDKIEYTDELTADDGIEYIEPNTTVLELDYDYSLDTDWDSVVNFKGKTKSDIQVGTQIFPDGLTCYNAVNGPWPAENDVVRREKDGKDFIWVGNPYKEFVQAEIAVSYIQTPSESDGSIFPGDIGPNHLNQLVYDSYSDPDGYYDDGNAKIVKIFEEDDEPVYNNRDHYAYNGEKYVPYVAAGSADKTYTVQYILKYTRQQNPGYWESYNGASFEWYSEFPISADRHAVLLRLDRLLGDDPVKEKDGSNLISAELLYTDTYVYVPQFKS